MDRTTSETFRDGVADLWKLNAFGYPETLYTSLHFQKRVVGSKRAYDAMLAGHTVQMLIWVPLRSLPEGTELYAVIDGVQYHVLQMQILPDKFPKLCQLTLELSPMLWARDEAAQLISCTYETDALRQRIPVEHAQEVVCTVRYIRQQTDFVDGLSGLRDVMTIAVPAAAYSGQTIVAYKGQRYAVDSSYQTRGDLIELTVSERAGV